jgi:hypothetical protein
MFINANVNPQRSFETRRDTTKKKKGKSERERKTLAKKKKVMKGCPPSRNTLMKE